MAKDNKGRFINNTEDKVIEIMNNRYKGFEYVSGYINADSHMRIRCKTCGYIFSYHADILRPSRNKTIRCKQCDEKDRARIKELKSEVARTNKELKKIYRLLKILLKNRQPKKEYIHTCKQCGKEFSNKRKSKMYCSDKCSHKIRASVKELKRRNNMYVNGYIDKNISLDRLIKRDKNICYICGEECNSSDYTITKDNHFVAGRSYPSIEHIVAVSKGGTHTWNNIKLAHCYCNLLKGNKTIT